MSVANATLHLHAMVYMSALTYIPLYTNKMLCQRLTYISFKYVDHMLMTETVQIMIYRYKN